MFIDRRDAGNKLATALEKYKGKEVLVLAIPRGGVEVAYQVAKYLDVDFSLLIARKFPYPDNPEAGFGAVAEDGSTFMFENSRLELPKEQINKIKEEQLQEIKRRIKMLRQGISLPQITGRIVILIDDGIAAGSTMKAAIMLCKRKSVRKIIVAVPVSGRNVAEEIGKIVDEMIVLEQPEFFRAVAQVYMNWYDVSDEEVINIVKKWQTEHKFKE